MDKSNIPTQMCPHPESQLSQSLSQLRWQLPLHKGAFLLGCIFGVVSLSNGERREKREKEVTREKNKSLDKREYRIENNE